MDEDFKISELEKLVDLFSQELEISTMYFKYMGLALDDMLLQECIQHYGMRRIYIYGAGYLGIQLYRGLKDKVDVVAVVDKSGGAKIPGAVPDVIGLEEFRDIYDGEHVIVVPINFYKEIISEIGEFIPKNRLLFVGEFLGGIS